jgi:membrane associated rhomboid family serine protease
MFVLAIIWTVGSVMGIFGLGDPNTGHIAHLSGLALGILYGFILRIESPKRKQTESESPLISEEDITLWENNHLGK